MATDMAMGVTMGQCETTTARLPPNCAMASSERSDWEERLRQAGTAKAPAAPRPPNQLPVWAPADLRTASWTSLSTSLREALRVAVKGKLWPWYLWGSTGTGKSYAAAAVLRKWKPGPLWLYAPDEIGRLVSARMRGSVNRPTPTGTTITCTREDIIGWIRKASLVVCDELALRAPNDYERDALQQIVECRGIRPVIYTGNLDPDRLRGVLDDRLVGRICSGLVLQVTGPNRRLQRMVSMEASS